MRGLVLQTQESAPPGLLADWADARGIRLDVLRVDQAARLPDPGDYAFAVALGSSASLAAEPPSWARAEIAWLRGAERAGVPVLGICFGAQALAVAHGGDVVRLDRPEVAWLQLDTCDEAAVPSGPWLSWHEDGIELPPFAYELARNTVGVQAFSVGRHLAVQFHPEVTSAIASAWAEEDDAVLARAGVSPERIQAETRNRAAAAAAAAHRMFDRFAARAGIFFDRATLVQA